jgi:hypothetical protein
MAHKQVRKGTCPLVLAVLTVTALPLVSCSTTIGECDIMCPAGMHVDVHDPGCTCVPNADAGADAGEGGG